MLIRGSRVASHGNGFKPQGYGRLERDLSQLKIEREALRRKKTSL